MAARKKSVRFSLPTFATKRAPDDDDDASFEDLDVALLRSPGEPWGLEIEFVETGDAPGRFVIANVMAKTPAARCGGVPAPSGNGARWSRLCYALQEDGTSSPTP